MKNLVSFLIIFGSLHQVTASTQASFLPQDKLVAVLIDLELTQVMIHQDISDDTQLAQKIFQEQLELIFNNHVIDQTLFQESYFHYLADPKQFKSLQEQVIKQLEKLLQETEKKE